MSNRDGFRGANDPAGAKSPYIHSSPGKFAPEGVAGDAPTGLFINDTDFQLYVGDVRDCLRELPDESVHTVVTSPPYWGLRDYGTGQWEGGDPDCDHKMPATGGNPAQGPNKGNNNFEAMPFKETCGKCGATRVDQQLGLEPTPDLFVAAMVDVFREVRRVLRSDGTLWLNLGDSYNANQGAGFNAHEYTRPHLSGEGFGQKRIDEANRNTVMPSGLPAKNLMGMPWRVAFALQQDGWILRSDIVWSKPNPMPESVTDRPTKAHEMVFLFSKAKWTGPERGRFADISDEDARWLALLFDAEGNVVVKKAKNGERTQYGAQVAFANTSRALIERAQAIVGAGSIHERPGTNAPMFYWQMTGQQARDLLYRIYPFLIVKPRQAAVAIHMQDVIAEPKKRPGGYRTAEHTAFLDKCWETVKALNSFEHPDLSWVPAVQYGRWATQPYFFDQEAVREPHESTRWGGRYHTQNPNGKYTPDSDVRIAAASKARVDRPDLDHYPHSGRNIRSVWEIATQPYSEAHFATFPEALPERCIKAGCPEGGTVLDPFMGSGTTALVARRLGRRSVGVELNPEYAALCARRLQQLSLEFA